MPRLKLLILDAGVVIRLHELGIWNQVLNHCEIFLSRIVVEEEVLYQRGDEYDEDIDLSAGIEDGRIRVFDVTVGELRDFRNQFDLLYIGDLDDGEAASLAYMAKQAEVFLISSGDAIVYRILGNMNLASQGISLEEVLQKIGMGRGLEWPYSKAFREKYTKAGELDVIQGRGHRHEQ